MPNWSRNLAHSEWEPHQAKITRLYHIPGMTRNKIKKIMLEEDQFDASKSQYDTMLKHWGLRKYLSAKEWREVIYALDSQRAQDSTYDLYDGDKIISELKLQRKRRLYCTTIASKHDPLDADRLLLHLPEGITIKRRTMQNMDRANVRCDTNSLPSFDGYHGLRLDEIDNATCLLRHNAVADSQTEIEPNCNDRNLSFNQLALTRTISGGQFASSPFSLFTMALDPDHMQGRLEDSSFSLLPLDIDMPEWSEISGINTTTDRPYHRFASPFTPILNCNWTLGAPFSESQTLLPSQALFSQNDAMSARVAIRDNPNQMSISSCHIFEQVDDVQLARLLIGDAMSVSSRRRYPAETQGLPSCEELLDSLRSQFLTGTVEEEFGERLDLIGGDDLPTTGFIRFFLFSIVNNFAGLENIPIEAIMRFISQHDYMITSIFHYLQSASTIFSHALAEKLFKAAIDTLDQKIIQLLLKTGLVNPNAIICFEDDERRWTPIERSATFRHFDITKCLLDAGADVNKTYIDEPSYFERGALECAIRKWGDYSPIDIRLVKLLLDHSAIVGYDLVGTAIRWGDENLITELMMRFDPSHHGDYINIGVFIDAAKFLHNDLSFRIIQQIVTACQDTHSNQCINSKPELCGQVMAQAAKRANMEVVKLLVNYSDQNGLDWALSMAIRSRSYALMEFLICSGANMNGEAPSIDYRLGISTTPLAEAIRAGDDELIARFEEAGALSQIGEAGCFGAAVYAASEAGNIAFLQKLFQIVPKFATNILTKPLTAAIKAKNEEIALYLLASGASMNSDPGPLIEALRVRGRSIISVILDCDVPVNGSTFDMESGSALEIAAGWGDMSIVEDLVFLGANINACHKLTPLIIAIQKHNTPLVKLLIKLGADLNLRSFEGESPLSAAVSTQDSSLLNYLLEHGADPASSSAIISAMKQDRATLNVLIRRFRERYPGGRIGFGGDVLQYALETQSDLHLDFCLSAKLDVNSLACSKEYGNVNSLGLVIRKYQGKRLDLVNKLLDAGGDINGLASRKGYVFQTAFLEAIETRTLPLVELLIRRGADLQKEAKLGLKRTPLQKACEIGSFPIVDLLLRHGANIHAAPAVQGGGDAFQLAAKAGSIRIANHLLNCGAKVNASKAFVQGLSALEYAAKYGRMNMIKVLWNASDTVLTLEQCESAILVAQENGHMACCHLLRNLFSSSQSFIGFNV